MIHDKTLASYTSVISLLTIKNPSISVSTKRACRCVTKTKIIRTAYIVTTTFAKLIPKPTMSPDGRDKMHAKAKASTLLYTGLQVLETPPMRGQLNKNSFRWPGAVKFLFPGLKTHYFLEHCNWSVGLYAYMHMKLLKVRLWYTVLDIYNRIIFVLIKRVSFLAMRSNTNANFQNSLYLPGVCLILD